MLDAVAVCLREGAELLLVAEALVLCLRRERRPGLATLVAPSMAAGVALALVLSAWAMSRHLGTELTTSVDMVFLVGIVSLACGMLSSAPALRDRVRSRVDVALASAWAPLLIVGFAAAAAFRESLEALVMLDGLSRSDGLRSVVAGALAGLVATALLAWVYRHVRTGARLLAPFRLSALLITLLAVEAMIGRLASLLHEELGEGNRWLRWSEPLLPGGTWYPWACAGLMVPPLAISLRAWWFEARE